MICCTLDFDYEPHKQCGLASGDSRYVAWIPSKVAKAGNRVRLIGDERLWTIATVGTVELEGWRLQPRKHDPMEIPNAEKWAEIGSTIRKMDWSAFTDVDVDRRMWTTPPEGMTGDGVHP